MTVAGGAEIADRPERWRVLESVDRFSGAVTSVRTDLVAAPNGETFPRDVVVHPGSVGILALDAQDNLALVRQYRHPVGFRLLEPPAGLLDVPGEDPLAAAQRELAEEVSLRAGDWRILLDMFSSPGTITERIRVYLARDLHPAQADQGVVQSEEADMTRCWAPVEDVAGAILAGRLHNPILLAGVLALQAARAAGGLDALRPAAAEPG